jgi:exonuclease SbcC
MAVRIRVKNFQSIESAEVIIDGLTAITGANNSGKTSLMRAIRGVFTNAPAGPLVRHGAAFLSVELVFDDGTTILWEKGWEKPGRKGKGVNRYAINGVWISGVGRGVPPEIENLGVRSVPAASERIWPQFAKQFDGTLFLVNRPGAVVAESLSDVDKVGKLTGALKLSERDRRSVTSELKIRRKDILDLEVEVKGYDGLDDVTKMVKDLDQTRLEAAKTSQELQVATGLRDRYKSALATSQALEGFDPHIPDTTKPLQFKDALKTVRALAQRKADAEAEIAALADAEPPEIPDSSQAERLGNGLKAISALRDRYETAKKAVDDLTSKAEEAVTNAGNAAISVQEALGDLGVCPVCDTIHTPDAAHA